MADKKEPQPSLELNRLNTAFANKKLNATATAVEINGPLLRYKISLYGQTRLEDLEKYSESIAMEIKATSEPIISPTRVDGMLDGTVSLDVMVGPHPVLHFQEEAVKAGFNKPDILKTHEIPLYLGNTDVTTPLIIDLQKQPHLLIAGATGSGKSQMLHSVIHSIETHSEARGIRLAIIDPKMVEFVAYSRSKALRYSVAIDVEGALEILDDLEDTLEKRLQILAANNCRNILEYRARGGTMPFVVLVCDEIAEVIKDKKNGFLSKLCSLASLGRAAGIHFVIATQDPRREVINGLLKAQFPVRISCKVASPAHSRIVLNDRNGAEKLQGKGDALLLTESGDLTRFRGCFVKPQVPSKKPIKPLPKTKTVSKAGFLAKLLG